MADALQIVHIFHTILVDLAVLGAIISAASGNKHGSSSYGSSYGHGYGYSRRPSKTIIVQQGMTKYEIFRVVYVICSRSF